MLYILFALSVFVGWSAAALHHLFVGTVDSGSVYVLEMDDMARTLTLVRNNSAAGASPSIAFDVSCFLEEILNPQSSICIPS